MAGFGMTFEIDENVTSTLDGIALRSDDLAIVLPALAAIGEDSIRENFAVGGRPRAWKPLKTPRTGDKILIKSSDLLTANQSRITGDNEIDFINNMVYARAHNEGFKRTVKVPAHQRMIKSAFGRSITPVSVKVKGHKRKMNLPKRRFGYIAPADVKEMQDIVAGYVVGKGGK